MQKTNCFKGYGPSPIPEEGKWVQSKNIKDVSGLTHGVGTCAPQQGACKLTINVKEGIICEALVETIGCSGMTHSAAMAGEILVGKTILEALNTDLVCDAINDAMQKAFLQLVYGRSQSAFSIGGLEVGEAMNDLGKHKSSIVGTVYCNKKEGVKYLDLAEGMIKTLALDENGEIIGYEYIVTPLLVKKLLNGETKEQAMKESTKTYGRFNDGVKFVNPRSDK